VIALEVLDEIKTMGYEYKEKPYEKSDLEGAFLVYACTNIIELNRQVKADAQSMGILTNVVDNPKLCDFVSPAIYKHDNIAVAVSSNAQNVYKAVEVRNKIKEILEHDPAIFNNPIKV
jgi:precorrin-2 dehydrogenase / sirohydrochlorin ferrochelatase